MPGGVIYRFGPFELNTLSHVLLRDGVRLPLGDRHVSIISVLAARHGKLVTKQQLMDAAWADTFVAENSLTKAISELREFMGDRPEGGPYVTTMRRKGYRLEGEISHEPVTEDPSAPRKRVPPLHRWVEGVAMLGTLKVEELRRAVEMLREVVQTLPLHAPAHVALANALAMLFEATRADAAPDFASLAEAAQHAQIACDLDAGYGEAAAALGFVLARAGKPVEALVKLREATMLEPDNWRHWVRLGSVASGEERLRAARRALSLMPGIPYAHFLAATVFIVRERFDLAEQEVRAGIAGYETQRLGCASFTGIALYWLLGLLQFARGDVAGALASFERELSFEGEGHIYAREVCAHTWHAIGALRLYDGDAAGAVTAFEEALRRVPAHPLAQAGLRIATRRMGKAPEITLVEARGSAVDIAMGRAALLSDEGDAAQGAALVTEALTNQDAGAAGWILPIEPLLNVAGEREVWTVALARLMGRAG